MGGKTIHVHVHRTKDASEEQEIAFQATKRAEKRARELVEKLSASAERIKAGRGVMTADLARQVEDLVRSASYKVV